MRVDSDAGALFDERGQRDLVVALDRAPLAPGNRASPASGSRRASSCSRFETHRSPMRLVISAVSFGLLSTIQRRGVTPLVTLKNFSGITAVEVAQHGLLEQFGVQRGDAVDRVAADARQVRHADVLVAGFVDQ